MNFSEISVDHNDYISTEGTAGKTFTVFTVDGVEGEFITFGGEHFDNKEDMASIQKNFAHFFNGKLNGKTHTLTKDFVPTHTSENRDMLAVLISGITTFFHQKIQ